MPIRADTIEIMRAHLTPATGDFDTVGRRRVARARNSLNIVSSFFFQSFVIEKIVSTVPSKDNTSRNKVLSKNVSLNYHIYKQSYIAKKFIMIYKLYKFIIYIIIYYLFINSALCVRHMFIVD